MKARTAVDAGTRPERRQAVTAEAHEIARLKRELARRERELEQALEQQNATSDILRVISRAPADLGSVLAALAAKAARLCEASDALILGVDGDVLRLKASAGPLGESFARDLMVPISRDSVTGRAAHDRTTVHVRDLAAEPEHEFPLGKPLQRRYGQRTVVATPLLLDDKPLGVIAVMRRAVQPFGARQLALLQTFADQAVIAIQNARLFNALQARNLEVSQALEQQTATSEILQVIGSSMADATPVFEKILDSCQCLFGASDTGVFLLEGNDLLNAVAWRGEFAAVVPGPRPLAGTMSEAVIRHGALRHWPNVLSSPDVPGYITEVARGHGDFSVAVAPLIRDGRGIGTLDVMRKPPRPFDAKELALLRSFADQAVIAILNACLFNETRQALEHQTATAEVLKVISESPTDVQPVFDAICERAMVLSGANIGGVTRFDGEWVHLVAFQGISSKADAAMRAAFPMRPSRASISARAVLEGVPVEIADVEKDPDYELKPQMRLAGYRSNLSVPMLRDGKAIGSITVCRPEPGTFPRPLVELLQTFADQAVIAIENVRLFNELQARNREVSQALDQQTATSEILRVISSSPTDVQPVFDAIANAALVLCRARSTNLLTYDGELLHQGAHALFEPGTESAARGLFPRPAGTDTAAGRAVLTRRVAVIPDVFVDPDYAARDVARLTGARSFLGVPLLRDGHPVGAIAVGRPEPGAIPDQQIALLQTFADQAVIAIENVRLFNELREKGEQLELASRHKSQFLANMSHELRTPLNAIIGFTRIVMRRTKDQIEPKQAENLEKILASGQHLLALINAVLDLSKIEAGRVEVAATEVELAPVLRQCVLTIEPLVKADEVSLVAELDGALPRMWVDEEKLRQIVINLLSNAAKFTASGSIRLGVRAEGENVRIAVTDTGFGIASDKLGLIFEEFEQADASSTRLYGGTGLGLAIARRLARLMGGEVDAESVPGRGSTFTLTLPLRDRAPAAN